MTPHNPSKLNTTACLYDLYLLILVTSSLLVVSWELPGSDVCLTGDVAWHLLSSDVFGKHWVMGSPLFPTLVTNLGSEPWIFTVVEAMFSTCWKELRSPATAGVDFTFASWETEGPTALCLVCWLPEVGVWARPVQIKCTLGGNGLEFPAPEVLTSSSALRRDAASESLPMRAPAATAAAWMGSSPTLECSAFFWEENFENEPIGAAFPDAPALKNGEGCCWDGTPETLTADRFLFDALILTELLEPAT